MDEGRLILSALKVADSVSCYCDSDIVWPLLELEGSGIAPHQKSVTLAGLGWAKV